LPDAFLQLPTKDRADILNVASQRLGRTPQVLEKDVWVCWTLEKLFAIAGAPAMAFKGGTSLSKVYDAISRFSEDVDVTLNREDLAPELDPFDKDLSNTKRKGILTKLDRAAATYIRDTVQPHFDECLARELGNLAVKSEFLEEKLELIIPYPTALADLSSYVSDVIKLEMGGRNKIVPSEVAVISPDIAKTQHDVSYPNANVSVLAPTRTFWEKATLIHEACNRSEIRDGISGQSRHWYDLARLADSSIGNSAIPDRKLLEDVVEQKIVLYRRSYSDYESCVNGGLRLVPSEELAQALDVDFGKMIEAKMFWEEPPTFVQVLDRLAALQDGINTEAEV